MPFPDAVTPFYVAEHDHKLLSVTQSSAIHCTRAEAPSWSMREETSLSLVPSPRHYQSLKFFAYKITI
ncbi:hypothetical protein PYCCODRAFT_1468272 [Trametes coccinea BRFM310]|uniref:Uncharacterized protein n=1 Tax=Trametes coccinea (strain BRFM310) TaxID=1353009 RepID=A0A1Y2INY2_TRAC3|nr:hypothetical protein PYCCODRAFT_1468272 [Trametes coccinea BRFM310]